MSLIIFFFSFSILTLNRPRGNVELFMKLTNLPTAEGFRAQDQTVERLTAEREGDRGFDSQGRTNTQGLKITEK